MLRLRYSLHKMTRSQVALSGVVGAWCILYTPLYMELAATAWTRPENSHAPLLLCFCIGAIAVRLYNLPKNIPGEIHQSVPEEEIYAG